LSNHDNALEEAAAWLAQGRRVALATVIETWGSAPRPVGSQLAIRDDAQFVGSVSGGCIEGDVVTRALETLDTGKTEILEYGVSDAMAWEVGLACGGRIRVMVEPVKG
jgi:xanthine/CO dehydrogenase XdhC/CoxF family maturation factor